MRRLAIGLAATVLAIGVLPTHAVGWTKASATSYAEQYALSPNPAWPYLRDSNGNGQDCTNFISQALKAGGIAMDTTRTDRSKWYMAKNINGVWIWGYPWTTAADFYTYFRTSSRTASHRYYIATYDWIAASSYVAPPSNNGSLNNGDIVSYDFDLSASDGIDHTSIVTYNGTDAYNSAYVGDLVCYHSSDMKRVIWHVKHRRTATQQQNMRIYAWGLNSALN